MKTAQVVHAPWITKMPSREIELDPPGGEPGPAGTIAYVVGKSFWVKTGTDGVFEMFHVPAGTHDVVVEAPGAPAEVLSGVQVEARQTTDVGEIEHCDQDGDGFDASVDCDDQDPDIHPNATESCNGVDDDCDGKVDEAGAEDSCNAPDNSTAMCSDGACVFQCDAGFTDCAGQCVDTDSDPNHCGGCGVMCPSGQTCSSGACQP